MMFSYTARAPLPESGRKSVSGRHWGGKPRTLATGEMIFVKKVTTPEVLSIPMQVISIIRAGRISKATFIFSAAPLRNSSKISTFLYMPYAKTTAMTVGITNDVIFTLSPALSFGDAVY